jgi:Fe-S cluster assembly scaffold protein SufB
MTAIQHIALDLNSGKKSEQKISLKVKPQTKLFLKIIGNFNNQQFSQRSLNITLAGRGSSLDLQGKFFICENSQLKLNLLIKGTKQTKAAQVNLDLRGLVFDKKSRVTVEQNISLNHKDSHLHHSLALGSLNPDILSYLSSRGVPIVWLKSYLLSNYAKI